MASARSRLSQLPQAILLANADAALAVARGLEARGVAVSILSEGRGRGRRARWAGWPCSSRSATGYALGELPDNRNEWIGCLETLAEDGDGVLISGFDRSTELLVEDRNRIPETLRSFESPRSAHMQLMDKGSLYELAARVGIRFPWTLELASHADLDRVAAEASYPCLLKPALSHLGSAHFPGRVIELRNADDLRRDAAPALKARLTLLVTEHIPGPDTNLVSAITVRAADGSYPLVFGKRKLRQFPPGFGSGGLQDSTPPDSAMTIARPLLDAVDYVGVSAVETKRHAETGEIVLIEVNVRLVGPFGLGDAAGTDASWRLYATLAGIPLEPQPRQVDGVKLIVPTVEPFAAGANLSQGRLTTRQLLNSYRGVRDLSGLSWRDPKPALALGALHLSGVARMSGRKVKERAAGCRGARLRSE
jgi:predicted ATP-grasp superfamily ATP-dependent carboligase